MTFLTALTGCDIKHAVVDETGWFLTVVETTDTEGKVWRSFVTGCLSDPAAPAACGESRIDAVTPIGRLR